MRKCSSLVLLRQDLGNQDGSRSTGNVLVGLLLVTPAGSFSAKMVRNEEKLDGLKETDKVEYFTSRDVRPTAVSDSKGTVAV